MPDARLRHAVRVLLLDKRDRLLLFRGEQPATGAAFWFPAGGGVEDGEDARAAALREVAEETGLTDVAVGPEVWRRRHVFTWRDVRWDQRERWFMARVPHFEPDGAGMTEAERSDLTDCRWWTLEELEGSADELVPRDLARRACARCWPTGLRRARSTSASDPAAVASARGARGTGHGMPVPDPFAGHADQPRPLGGYGALVAAFNAGMAAFLAAADRRDRLPERYAASDLALMAVATHKLSRLLAKDRVTSVIRAPFTRFQDDAGHGEVDEAARGQGLRRAIGELLVCDYCLAQWVAGGFVAAHAVAPRPTRTVAALYTVYAAADVLQVGYSRLLDAGS